MGHRTLRRPQLKACTPRPRHKWLKHELAEIRAQPTVGWHQQHGFLLIAAFAEGDQERAFRPPRKRPYVEVSHLTGPDNNKEVVRLLRRWQHTREQHFILPLPDTWLRALKDAVDHCQRMIRIEASDAVESHVPHDLGACANASVDENPCRVEVRASRKAPRITFVFPKTAMPNAPKTCDCNQHLFHAPFKRLFFCRSAYNSSCSRLI